MTYTHYIPTTLGILPILITYFQTILKNNKNALAEASYSTWGLFSVALISYFLGMLLSLSAEKSGIFAKIYTFLIFLAWTTLLINSIWFLILQGSHKNIKKFWGYLINIALTIKNGIVQSKEFFIVNMLDLILIFLATYGLVVLFCFLFTKNKKCGQLTSTTKTEYTIWVLGYLFWFTINSLGIKWNF